MADQQPENDGDNATADPNEWDRVGSIYDFIVREWTRLLPKIPVEFSATHFKIQYRATFEGKKVDGFNSIHDHFLVTMTVAEIGEVGAQGPNPFGATMFLIDDVYKRYAQHAKWEEVRRQRDLADQRERFEKAAALQSLTEHTADELADMDDGILPLPNRVTKEMVASQCGKIALEHLRGLTDPDLISARPPKFLSHAERQRFGQRCDSEYKLRDPVRKLLNAHHKSWPVGKDDLKTLLDIWRCCGRQSGTLQSVVTEYFQRTDITPLTLDGLLRIAPEFVKQVRRNTAFRNAEAAKVRNAERDAERERRFQPVG